MYQFQVVQDSYEDAVHPHFKLWQRKLTRWVKSSYGRKGLREEGLTLNAALILTDNELSGLWAFPGAMLMLRAVSTRAADSLWGYLSFSNSLHFHILDVLRSHHLQLLLCHLLLGMTKNMNPILSAMRETRNIVSIASHDPQVKDLWLTISCLFVQCCWILKD